MNKILIVGTFACLSAVAVAQATQSDQSKDKAATPAQAASPQDVASGQMAGKRMHKPLVITKDDSSRQASPTYEKGKTTSTDDWQATAAKGSDSKTGKDQSRVAIGDVNGDGTPDVTAPKNPGQATVHNTAATSTNSDVKSPRDVASGQSSGKRQHDSVPPAKKAGTNPKK